MKAGQPVRFEIPERPNFDDSPLDAPVTVIRTRFMLGYINKETYPAIH
jgi:hypothetical protein